MSFAEDTSRVRREIEEMRSSRIAFNQRLNRFAADLRRSMNEKRASMRKHNSEQAASTKAALASFVVQTRRMTHEALVGFQRERSAAHRAWLRMGPSAETGHHAEAVNMGASHMTGASHMAGMGHSTGSGHSAGAGHSAGSGHAGGSGGRKAG